MLVCGLGSSGSGQGKLARCNEHGNQRSGSIKRGEFLDYRTAGNMARGIPYCPSFFLFLLPDQRLHIVKNMCVCVCVYIYIYTHTHTPVCVQIVYELPSLPSTTACETFLRKSGTVRSVDWTFIIVALAWR